MRVVPTPCFNVLPGTAGAVLGNFTLEAASHPLSPAVQRVRYGPPAGAELAVPNQEMSQMLGYTLPIIFAPPQLCGIPALWQEAVLRGCEPPAFSSHMHGRGVLALTLRRPKTNKAKD